MVVNHVTVMLEGHTAQTVMKSKDLVNADLTSLVAGATKYDQATTMLCWIKTSSKQKTECQIL